MTRNRLIDAASEGTSTNATMGKDGLQAWCDERNAWATKVGLQRFYRVINVDFGFGPRWETEVLEGWRALEARAEAEGCPIERFVPGPGEMKRLRRGIERMARKGKETGR